MSSSFEPRHLDVAAFARAKARLSARDSLQKYERLALEVRASEPDLTLEWQVQGEQRSAADGVARPALHVQANARLPLTCQRCMGEVRVDVQVDRHVLFARDEDSAAALDDVSEDDVLALTPDLDLHDLIEDELLMALPLVPRHEVCPQPLRLSAQDADFEAAQEDKQHPFAALAVLKGGKKH
ncbi:MAG: DUF177 domain-containing protein [Burkholderiales bacterium]|nr:DUF177 domain-containing protein [Burkholderiales bacterium]MBS0401812.1 DUF177 domain-containing protein [Pseudomonadota bacterium]MBS0414566.1 DUF177 domain-containing protein [Pseudomonadota bacterium]